MKHSNRLASILALALLPATSSWAQSSVNVYGLIDVSLQNLNFSSTAARGNSHLRVLTSDTTRLGFRGSEDLGGGLRAYFKIETGLQMDTGAQTSPTAFWNRETYVGLADTQLGAVQIGSQFAPGLLMSLKADPFTRLGQGAQYTLLQGVRGYQSRYDNAVQYTPPTLAGVTGRVFVAAGEGAVTGASYSGLLEYSKGPLYVGAVYDQVKATAASVGLQGAPVTSRTLSLASTYDFKSLKLFGWLQENRVPGLQRVKGYMVGATVPVTSGEIRTSYVHRSAVNADASLVSVGYAHFLSKRTQLYATVGRLTNEGTAAFRMVPSASEQANAGLPAAGQDMTGTQLGVRHFF